MPNTVKVLTFTEFGDLGTAFLPRAVNDAAYVAGTQIFKRNVTEVPTTAALVAAIKAMDRKLERVQAQNEQLKKRLERAEALIIKLKQRIQ